MSPSLSIRMPPPLPPLSTGDAALDAALRVVVDTYEAGKFANTEPLYGAGGRLAPALVPELLDGGETRWDDAVAQALPAEELAAYRARSQEQYKANNARRGVLMALLEELATDAVGQARMREALSFPGQPALRAFVAAEVLRVGAPEDLRALAAAYPDEGEDPTMFAFAARMRLDPDYAASLADRLAAMSVAAQVAVFRAAATTAIAVPPEWEPALIAALATASTISAEPLLRALPPSAGRLGALLALPGGAEVARALAAFDTPEVARRLAAMVSETTLADGAVRAALRGSALAESAHAGLAIVAALEAAGERPARKKPFEEMAKELCAKHGVVPPKKPRAKAGPSPAEPWPAAPAPVALPTPAPGLFATMSAALAAAGIDASLSATVLSPAAHLGAERVDEATLEVGASKLGGRPDLPKDMPWPEHDGVAMTFVAQLRLADLAELGVCPPLPPAGSLLLFVADEGLEELPTVGAALLLPEGSSCARRDPPKSFQKHRAGRPARQTHPACRVTFAATAQLADPSHPAAAPLGEAYAAAQARFARSPRHTVLGFPDGWQGDLPAGARQLLVVHPDPQPAFSWGDAQALAFLARDADLVPGRITRVTVRVAP